jgi:lipoprotein NlpI
MACFIFSGCASNAQNNDPFMSGLLLAEPEPISARSQILIAQYTHTLYQAKLTEIERAEFLFQRGIAYDSIGLSSLARMDYAEAIKLNPTLAEAYNSVGVHFIQAGMFMRAYESFDSSLEINPSYENAILNRGIALYYGGRSELALQDTLAFLEKDTSDPYRVLWHYIIQVKLDPVKAVQDLSLARVSLDEADWATSIVDFYLDKMSESQVIATLLLDVKSQTQLNNRLCEVYFYLGKFHAASGNTTKAENYFKLALSTNVYEYVEHKYARIELNNLRQERRLQIQ